MKITRVEVITTVIPQIFGRLQGQMPVVQFSADPTHSYLIQSSTDLLHWTTIGAPVQEAGTGDYDFTDTNAGESTCNFYRIVTN